jgi:hypothetical protein
MPYLAGQACWQWRWRSLGHSHDYREGVAAFKAKHTPSFEAR